MARCDYCGTTILFGGVKDANLRFCNDTCHQQGFLLAVADQVPEDLMTQHVTAVHRGTCPKCDGRGPIDVHNSYTVWSALLITSWKTNPEVCCRSCGIKSKLGAVVTSGVVGWWGIPWGILVTPVQIMRNVTGLFSSPDPTAASEQLEKIVRLELAAQIVEASQNQPAEHV